MHLNLDLVRKYNVPGPRYTSYPPATQFTTQVAWPGLVDELLSNNTTERDLSLYFHIPFCQSLCWYCGCTTVITTQQGQSATYIKYLRKELSQLGTVLNPRRKLVQLHWGGGTPTFMKPEEIRELGEAIRAQFRLSPNLEAGVEIDPRRITPDHLAALRDAGFNRASIGVQDFDPIVQRAVHRVQPRELTEDCVRQLRALGFRSINIDLIYGLPYQTVETFRRTLDQVIALNPDRIAVFSYAHVPWLKPVQKILEQALPLPETKLQLLDLVIAKLTGVGKYHFIGMDHFARNTDELATAHAEGTLHRNFQGYSTRGCADTYSFGMSSISQTTNAYWQNAKELPAYYAALDAGRSPIVRGYILSDDDKLRRETIMRVMCAQSLDYRELSERFGFNFEEYFAHELNSLDDLEADGLIHRTRLGLRVTALGRFFLRNIAMRFDSYLPREMQRQFSKTI